MQGHKSVVGSSTGTIDFDHGTGSSNAGIGADLFWSDQPLPDILPSSGGSGVLHFDSTSGGGLNMSLWSQGEGSSSSMQNGWSSGGVNTDAATGSSHVVSRPLTLWASSSEASHQTQPTSRADVHPHVLNLNVKAYGQSEDLIESHVSPMLGFSMGEKRPVIAATHSVVTPGNGNNLMGGNTRGFDSSYDAGRLPLKRKFIGEDIGQSSTNASTRSYQQGRSWHPIPVDNSDNDPNIETSHTYLQPVYEISPSSNVSGSMPNVTQLESRRNRARNVRLRLRSGVQHTVPVQIGSSGSAFTPSADSGLLPPIANVPTLLPFTQEVWNQQPHPTSAHVVLPRNGHSRRRSRGSSSRSNSSDVVISERNDAPNTETMLRISRQILQRDMHAFQLIRSSLNTHLSVSGGGGSSSDSLPITQPEPNPSLVAAAALNYEPNTSFDMPAGLTWEPGHSSSSRQRIELLRRVRIATDVSDHAGSSNNQSLPISGASSSRHSVSTPGISGQRNQLAHRRLALLMQRRGNGVPGATSSLQSLGAAGDERSRLFSEIWGALEGMRHGEPLRPEDMMVLDQVGLFGMAAELHDRHRDMRLDVDNMSYEELLALEERIGNVNTGLTEEAVVKGLKQRKHTPAMVAASSETSAEPCCICQEEYNEGEELGILDCSHNFHTACVKQWLMVKNVCPICKTTGLGSQ